MWRRGDTVLKETGPWASTVHALLRHLEAVGFEGSPRVVGTGFDESGREVVTFLEGESAHPHAWTEEALPLLGRLLRDLHVATASFSIPRNATWRSWHGRRLGSATAIGHCDTGPWNVVA